MQRIKTLVVDDSAVARRMISDIIAAEDDFELVGTASNGRLALARIEQSRPHLVTLDIHMPEMDGMEALAAIRARYPQVRVIMVSNLTHRGAAITVDALFLGASDYVAKAPPDSSDEGISSTFRDQLLGKARAVASSAWPEVDGAPPAVIPHEQPQAAPRARIEAVVMVASTGGPKALTEVLGSLPEDFRAPVLVVQHLPASFTPFLAQRLDAACGLPVREAEDMDWICDSGGIWFAPGDRHLKVRRDAGSVRVFTTLGPPVNACRPSADILFSAAAQTWGASTLAVTLTGMGRDGLDGCREVHRVGGQVIAQDRGTSVVWGIPGQVAGAGLADAVLPLDQIGPEIVRRVARGNHRAAADLRPRAS